MKHTAARCFRLGGVLLAAGVAAGCGPEHTCREGLRQLAPRIEGSVNAGEYAEAREQIAQARVEMTLAEEAAAQGDFETCVAKVESARVLLNRSQRN